MFGQDYFGHEYFPPDYFPDLTSIIPPVVVGGDSNLFFDERHLKTLFMGRSAHIIFAPRMTRL